MFTLTKKYQFSAAHMIEGHPVCGHLHGHNYVVTVSVDYDETNPQMLLSLVNPDSVVLPVLGKISGKFMISSENIKMKNPYVVPAVDRLDGWVMGIPTTHVQDIAEYIATNVRELLFGDVVVSVDDGTQEATFWCGANG